MRLGAVEETKFKSKDGTEIHGFLVKPPDYQSGKRYPTILRIHGGPVGQFECSFEEEWQWFAANGYVVVAANPRGSSGRGEKFQAAIYADWGNVDTADVPPLTWSDATVEVGDVVVTVTAGGHQRRAAWGQVTATEAGFRGPRGRPIQGAIEHATPCGPGSSGAPGTPSS